MQTSSDLFDASKAFVRITQTLEATCSANLPTCLATTERLAVELIAAQNCGVDYSNKNPQVLQAFNGLLAYEPVYRATCLRDDGGSYCTPSSTSQHSAPR